MISLGMPIRKKTQTHSIWLMEADYPPYLQIHVRDSLSLVQTSMATPWCLCCPGHLFSLLSIQSVECECQPSLLLCPCISTWCYHYSIISFRSWFLKFLNPHSLLGAPLVNKVASLTIWSPTPPLPRLFSSIVSVSHSVHLVNLSTLFITSFRLCPGFLSGTLIPPSIVSAQSLRNHSLHILLVSATLSCLFVLHV
jgi:hypothetical protein